MEHYSVMGFSPKRVTWGHLGSSGLPRFLEPIQLTTGPLEAYWPLPECSVVQAFTGYGPISTWAADEMNDSRHVCFDGSRLTALEGEHQPAHAEREYFWRQRPFPAETNKKGRAKIAWECLNQVLDEWLFEFPCTFAISGGPGFELQLDYRFGLLSVIALQLVQVVAGRAVFFCAECQKPATQRRIGSTLIEGLFLLALAASEAVWG